jgi:RHS repeat-associated protein
LSGLIAGQVSGSGGITESHTYNKSLEYTSTQATSSAGTALNLALNYTLTGGDNGSVTGITNNVDSGRTQTLAYDPLNRILSAKSSATSGVDCWGQSFSTDALANLDAIGVTQCSGTQLNVTVDGNNHITTSGFAYDATGNMNQDGTPGVVYSFDAENRLYKVSGVTGGPYCYVYDGNGLRVAKKSGANSDCTGGTVVKLYWRGLSGDALAETDGTGSTTNSAYNEYVFFAGRRVGSRNGTGGIFYWFADQLGTTRSITTGNGPGQTTGQLCYDTDFTPYGQEMQHTEHLQTTACPPNYRFTGYEYDSETGLNYAFARYYSPRLGRFLSTDPLGGSIGSLQSHNAYTYTVNNPLNSIDPSVPQLLSSGAFSVSSTTVAAPIVTNPPAPPPIPSLTKYGAPMTCTHYVHTKCPQPPIPTPEVLGPLESYLSKFGPNAQTPPPTYQDLQNFVTGLFYLPSIKPNAETQAEALYCAGMALTGAGVGTAVGCLNTFLQSNSGTVPGVPSGPPLYPTNGGGWADQCWTSFSAACIWDPNLPNGGGGGGGGGGSSTSRQSDVLFSCPPDEN